MKIINTKIKKWFLPKPVKCANLKNCKINYILQIVLQRRGIDLEHELDEYLSPAELPDPNDHFKDLNKATKRIIDACHKNEKIAICGDYDADGITSTVLLVELLNNLGAKAKSYIPSRKEDGYGLNLKMIDEIHINGTKLAITVDNGISALDSIEKSKKYGIDLIITDHHKITNSNLDIYALIHPENSPINSPYKYLAGVGIAFMLAKNICNILNYNIDESSAKALFCIGTIADMAPLIGANRKWLKDYLPKLKDTSNPGIIRILKKQSLYDKEITTEDIGYKIAPIINAVGRIGDPQLIVEMFTSLSKDIINKSSKECFSLNNERKRITKIIEIDAMKQAAEEYTNNRTFLVLSKSEWHPGIIGIVAARIVDKYNLPTAILAEANNGIFRGSIRSNNIKVNLALHNCKDILLTYGGHSAAAGFSIREENIPLLKDRLDKIAKKEMKSCNLVKSISPDAYINFNDINDIFYSQLMLLGPFGMNNKAPLFWTRKCRVMELYKLKGNHYKLKLFDGSGYVNAVKWNQNSTIKINDLIDIAFYIEINKWKKINELQINIIDIKPYNKIIELQLHKNVYQCQLLENKHCEITNSSGQSIRSDMIQNYTNNNKKEIFTKKMLHLAEIALGKAA